MDWFLYDRDLRQERIKQNLLKYEVRNWDTLVVRIIRFNKKYRQAICYTLKLVSATFYQNFIFH